MHRRPSVSGFPVPKAYNEGEFENAAGDWVQVYKAGLSGRPCQRKRLLLLLLFEIT
jgi:hypothetical protein